MTRRISTSTTTPMMSNYGYLLWYLLLGEEVAHNLLGGRDPSLVNGLGSTALPYSVFCVIQYSALDVQESRICYWPAVGTNILLWVLATQVVSRSVQFLLWRIARVASVGQQGAADASRLDAQTCTIWVVLRVTFACSAKSQ